MPNLLRKCENCVFSRTWKVTGDIECHPKAPLWLLSDAGYNTYADNPRTVFNYVLSTDAESCPAFRLRDTGVNE